MQLVRVSGKRVLRGLRSAESLESMTTNGNLKGALGNSNGGNHCVFCINRLCVCNPTFLGPLYGNNELLCWYLCHQPFISFDTLSPARWKSVTVHVTLSIRTKQKVSALCLRKILLGGLDFLSATHLSL